MARTPQGGGIRQYKIFYRTPESIGWVELEPGAHQNLYDVEAVHTAVEILQQHPEIQAVCAWHGDWLLNIVVFDSPALATNAFILHPGDAS